MPMPFHLNELQESKNPESQVEFFDPGEEETDNFFDAIEDELDLYAMLANHVPRGPKPKYMIIWP